MTVLSLLYLLEPLEHLLRHILNGLHSIGFTWAWSICVLTVLVRMLLVPLTVKQIHSMQSMQAHAPQMKEIQRKYKSDRQKMNEELMKFYKENSINPASSCLPILFQIPIFISLFFVLRDFDDEVFPKYPESDLGWLGIVDSITDPINSHWSGWLLLVIYVGSQLASVISMPMTDPRQRYIFLGMPFVIIPFIITFPMGLMLYWSTTNLWSVGQGLVTRRLAPKPPPPQKRSSRTPPKAVQEPAETEAAPGAEAAAKPVQPGQQRVRRRKKKGPRARR